MTDDKSQKPRLVSDTAERMRDLILAQPPDTQIGSLNEVAEQLGVGIVTLQQAARILEHEGLLAVKRGPGGGYYGTRPDDAALERAFATYMRLQNISYRDGFEMAVVLDCDIIEAAAGNRDEGVREQILALMAQLERCASAEDRIQFEEDLRATLFRIVDRPLMELVARVAMRLYKADTSPAVFASKVALQEWQTGRQRILHAILQQDPELAYFEADRFRRLTLRWSREHTGNG